MDKDKQKKINECIKMATNTLHMTDIYLNGYMNKQIIADNKYKNVIINRYLKLLMFNHDNESKINTLINYLEQNMTNKYPNNYEIKKI